jgi:hypothetical protein
VKNRFLYFLAVQLGLCLLILLIWPRLIVDDSYIFLTYARNFAKSGMFAFNPGEVSYGFSSPAYVILLGGVSRLSGIPVGIVLSNLVGVLFCGLSSAAVWLIWGEVGEVPSTREMLPLSVLLSGPWFFTVWFLFGMETGLAVMSLLGFLLWLLKIRTGAPRWPWLFVGLIATSLLATTRLESGIYIAVGIILAFATARSLRERIDLAAVAVVAGGAELAWLLYARHTFGTPLPWTSTARLIFYLPGHFGLDSSAQFYSLGSFGRSIVALKAAAQLTFGGPLKLLLVFVPLALGGFFLWSQPKSLPGEEGRQARLKWILQVAFFSMVLEIGVFVYLFPLVQNRHLAPYIAGIWVLISLPLVRAVSRMPLFVRRIATAIILMLWIGGVAQYRHAGQSIKTLHTIAASGALLPTDRVAAEPIGILSFETPAYLIDIGGLTDRSVWPLLMPSDGRWANIVAWSVSRGATKILLKASDCGAEGRHFDNYCLIDAGAAQAIMNRRSPHPDQR